MFIKILIIIGILLALIGGGYHLYSGDLASAITSISGMILAISGICTNMIQNKSENDLHKTIKSKIDHNAQSSEEFSLEENNESRPSQLVRRTRYILEDIAETSDSMDERWKALTELIKLRPSASARRTRYILEDIAETSDSMDERWKAFNMLKDIDKCGYHN